MKIIINEFPSPSLKKRIQKLGFNNIINIDNINFYNDPEPAPVLIDSNPIEKLAYLIVGKTYEDVNTYTFGAPPGDRLVFRNK